MSILEDNSLVKALIEQAEDIKERVENESRT